MKTEIDRGLIDRKQLLDIASVCMFLHVLCGLMRYLMNLTFVLALDYASSIALLISAVIHWIRYRPRLISQLKSSTEHILLFLLLGWSLISLFANLLVKGTRSAFFAPNALHDTLLIVLVFFPYGRHAARYGVPRLGRRLFDALLILWTLFILFVLINVFTGKVVALPGDIRLGIYDGQPFRLNNNSNHASCFEFVFLFLCLFRALYSKKAGLKALFVVFSLIHFTGMVLGDSRTYLYSAMLYCAALVFFCAFHHAKKRAWFLRAAVAVLLGVCAAAALYLTRNAVHSLYDRCAKLFRTPIADETVTYAEKTLVYEDLSTLSHRTNIWKGCIKALFADPFIHFFGMGIANSKQLVFTVVGSELYTHNEFLEVAVCIGVPGLALFIAFICCALKNALRVLFRSPYAAVCSIIALFIPVMLIANCTEALLLFYRRPGSYAFWLCCGWICALAKNSGDGRQNITEGQ